MRVLVTGSAGYIGPVVVQRLVDDGHEVMGYDLEWFGKDNGVACHFVRGDIRDRLVTPRWPDVVVHLAGISNDPMGDLDPDMTRFVNRAGTLDLVGAHRYAHHVVISSCAVYGHGMGISTEGTPPNPQTVYAECKAEVDAALAESDYEYVSLRLGTVYGYAPNHRLDLVVNRMVYDAVYKGVVTAIGDAARPLVHVRDVADAVAWAVKGTEQGVYNVIGENVRMRRLALDIAAHMGVKAEFKPDGVDTRDYMASGSKLLKAGWSPTRSVLGSLDALVADTEKLTLYPDAYIRLTNLKRRIDATTTLRRTA